MMEYELENRVRPQNLLGEAYPNKIKKLIYTAQELGGTIYDVAVDSGLLSAAHFMEQQFTDEDRTLVPERMIVVTEVYVEFGKDEPLDRIFLYSDNAVKDRELLQEGEIRDRKLVIPYGKLEALHEKGYKCIYGNAPDGRNGKSFARYNHSFGADRRLVRYEMWDWFPYVGNGFNQGLIVQTVFDTLLVMPDVYAVQESVKTYHAENLIRENVDAIFCIERISMEDKAVLESIQSGEVDILGSNIPELYRELRDSYKKLIYQIAYIRMYYPEIYEIVWAEDFEADDENSDVDIFWDNGKYVTLGICLDEKETYAVCRMPDGNMKRVPNMDIPWTTPLCQKYKFKGYGMIRNAGAAGSRMAIIMKDIIKSAEFMLDVSVKQVNVTHPGQLPSFEEIDWWMQRRRKRALDKKGTDATGDLIAYDQIAALKPDGEGVIRWAAEQADISGMVLVDSFDATMKAIEARYPDTFLADKVYVMYFFTEAHLAVVLVKKHTDGSFELLEQVVVVHPEEDLYYGGNCEGEDAWLPGLQEILEHDMEEYMLQSGLGALGVSVNSPYDRDMEAWAELRSCSKRIKRQFRRNDTVNLVFDNIILQLEKEYPIERLEKCFAPVLEKSARCLESVLSREKMQVEDIAGLFLIGEETEYPFVRKHMEQLVGKEAKCLNASECVEARGAALF